MFANSAVVVFGVLQVNCCCHFSFPDLMQESIHYAHCYIPASMAAILEEKPQLIAPAVRAFYYRDPVDLQVLGSSYTQYTWD